MVLSVYPKPRGPGVYGGPTCLDRDKLHRLVHAWPMKGGLIRARLADWSLRRFIAQCVLREVVCAAFWAVPEGAG